MFFFHFWFWIILNVELKLKEWNSSHLISWLAWLDVRKLLMSVYKCNLSRLLSAVFSCVRYNDRGCDVTVTHPVMDLVTHTGRPDQHQCSAGSQVTPGAVTEIKTGHGWAWSEHYYTSSDLPRHSWVWGPAGDLIGQCKPLRPVSVPTCVGGDARLEGGREDTRDTAGTLSCPAPVPSKTPGRLEQATLSLI